MILLDGASLDYIAPAAAGGRVPNFGRLLESGAVMHLATLRPTQPAPVWTAVGTGKLPYKTTVYSAARYLVSRSSQRLDLLPDLIFAHSMFRFGLLSEVSPTADMVRARPIWELVSSFGMTTGVIDWPLTYPAHAVRGYLVSDEFLRLDDSAVLAASHDDPPLVSPPDLLDAVRMARSRATPEASHAVDASVEQIAHELNAVSPAQFTAVRYPGLDNAGHYYLRYAMPRAFGDVSDEERSKYGRVLEQYYTYVDGIVGRAMASMASDDLLLVVSGFGMEPLSFGKRVLERLAGDSQLSGTHEGAPDGFLMAYGRDVAKGSFQRASVVDVAPTVLYFLGLPIARDMDGFARTDIFAPTFTERRPITFIPFYDR
jgi:predicted AlkP superfamily phosphohydrolase/phosphomutase